MKLDLKDLKKMVKWIEENTNAEKVDLQFLDNKIQISTMDKYESQVEILLFENGSLMPKIRKTDIL